MHQGVQRSGPARRPLAGNCSESLPPGSYDPRMKVRGLVQEVGVRDALFDPVNSKVWLLQGRTIVGQGLVDRDDTFTIEIDASLRGTFELKIDLFGSVPLEFDIDDDTTDVDLLVLISRGGSNVLA